jgi:hypothetical protein
MDTLKILGLIGGLSLLLIAVPAQAANTMPNVCVQNPLQGIQLAHDLGYPHYHGNSGKTTKGSGRIRSYQWCSQNVFEPCKAAGGSFCYCNTKHHLCTYGHTNNCSTCC